MTDLLKEMFWSGASGTENGPSCQPGFLRFDDFAHDNITCIPDIPMLNSLHIPSQDAQAQSPALLEWITN